MSIRAPVFSPPAAAGLPARELHGGGRQLTGEQLRDEQQHKLGVVLLLASVHTDLPAQNARRIQRPEL